MSLLGFFLVKSNLCADYKKTPKLKFLVVTTVELVTVITTLTDLRYSIPFFFTGFE